MIYFQYIQSQSITTQRIWIILPPFNDNYLLILLTLMGYSSEIEEMQSILLSLPQYYICMEKQTWQAVITNSEEKPSPRWGHSSVYANNHLFVFGGYAESNYNNELWAFNIITGKWQKWNTTGDQPERRSNCTLHYDQTRQRLILFGGGTENKIRLKDVRSLDLSTKEWTLLATAEGDQTPWDRTYHSSEWLYPFLFVFGGEAISDLDDLWAFNLQSRKWTQVPFEKGKSRPVARRFHSSALLGTTLYIIAGCYEKYRCHSDIFSIDLASFMKQPFQCKPLQWREIKVKGNSFLTRWGHTTAVLHDQIYIFGGRFSTDLNDVLVFDPSKELVKPLKVRGQQPKPRRRSTATFVGASLLVFGGFNGVYFDDLHFINLYEPAQPKIECISEKDKIQKLYWVNNSFLSDIVLSTKDKEQFYAHKGFIINRFRETEKCTQFLQKINGQYSSQELQQIFQVLYSGIGTLSIYPFNFEAFSFKLYDTQQEKQDHISRFIKNKPFQSLSLQPKISKGSKVIQLQSSEYNDYVDSLAQMYNDFQFIVNQHQIFVANKAILASSCEYFYYLFKQNSHINQMHLTLSQHQFGGVDTFQTILNFLHTEYLVVPTDLDEDWWMRLFHLGEYFCLTVNSICEGELVHCLNSYNAQRLLEFSIKKRLNVLKEHCVNIIVRDCLKEDDKMLKQMGLKKDKTQRQAALWDLYQLWEFHLAQIELRQNKVPSTSKTTLVPKGNKENTAALAL